MDPAQLRSRDLVQNLSSRPRPGRWRPGGLTVFPRKLDAGFPDQLEQSLARNSMMIVAPITIRTTQCPCRPSCCSCRGAWWRRGRTQLQGRGVKPSDERVKRALAWGTPLSIVLEDAPFDDVIRPRRGWSRSTCVGQEGCTDAYRASSVVLPRPDFRTDGCGLGVGGAITRCQ